MESRDPSADEQPSRLGYIAAIAVSAIGHLALAALVFFVLPQYLTAGRGKPEVYSIKIVGELPAGDLGTHLPKLSSRRRAPKNEAESALPEEPKVVAKSEPRPAEDENAIALNTLRSPVPTPEPAATPPPRAESEARAAATSRPTPERSERRKPEANPSAAIVKAERTPSVEERLDKLRAQLLAEHLAKEKEEAEDQSGEAQPAESGGGPVVASRAIEGKGTGVGPGIGSAGIQQAPEFLLYYRTVQDKVKKAWSFSGGESELTTTVNFAIGADGNLTGVKITQSSQDSAFDDSVIRAIRHAAPFPPPPANYRSQFAEGVEAVFKLGELSS